MRPITDDPKPRHATKALLPDGQGTLYGMLHHAIETALTLSPLRSSDVHAIQKVRLLHEKGVSH